MRLSSRRTEFRPARSAAWAVFVGVLCATVPARAQTISLTVATGLVVDVPLSGAAEQNFELMGMQPGTAKSVAAQDVQTCTDGCTAGRWRFQNISRKATDHRANLQFVALPDSLVGPGGAKLGVAYTARACVYNRATNLSLGCVTQSPSIQGSTVVVPINKVAGAIGDQSPALARDIYLWLGGTASPRVGQRAGDYSGVVTVFFFYN
ncbi:MAG: hypothetical protein HOQ15_03600 [Gemmatimonadaceae bacterium]|nr:hypothetical protein [Gemmatimonadaceae bacterium]